MKNVLVTGSNGQLGSDLRELSTSYQKLNFLFTDIEELDLTDKKALNLYFAQYKPDYCINCAAYTAVDKAEDEPDMAIKINEETAANLAQVCAEYQAKLIHISTDYVFDGTNHRPYREIDTPAPNSIYGLSKLKGEEAIEQINPDSMIIRTSWLYSSYGGNFVKTMMRLSEEKESLNVVSDQVGTPTYSADLATAILKIISFYDKSRICGTYHYSNEGAISWYDFAHAIIEITKASCKVFPIESKDFPAKANRPFYSVLNKSKIKANFNISIPYWLDSLKIAIRKINNQ